MNKNFEMLEKGKAICNPKNWKLLKGSKIKDVKILDESDKSSGCSAFLILDNGMTLFLCATDYYPFVEILDKKGFDEWKDIIQRNKKDNKKRK